MSQPNDWSRTSTVIVARALGITLEEARRLIKDAAAFAGITDKAMRQRIKNGRCTVRTIQRMAEQYRRRKGAGLAG